MFEGTQFAVSCSTEGARERAGNGAGGPAAWRISGAIAGWRAASSSTSRVSIPCRAVRNSKVAARALFRDWISCGPECGQMFFLCSFVKELFMDRNRTSQRG